MLLLAEDLYDVLTVYIKHCRCLLNNSTSSSSDQFIFLSSRGNGKMDNSSIANAVTATFQRTGVFKTKRLVLCF